MLNDETGWIREHLTPEEQNVVGREHRNLFNGNLTIQVDIQLTIPSLKTTKQLTPVAMDSGEVRIAAAKRLSLMLDSKKEADFLFVSKDGRQLAAHRCILAASSKAFEAMLTSDVE